MCIMCFTPSTWKVWLDEMMSSKCGRDDVMLFSTYPVHGSEARQIAQVQTSKSSPVTIILLSCRLINHLDSFWHCFLSSKSWTSIAMASWAACAKKVCKLCVNPHISIVNLLQTDVHTYKYNLRLRLHQQLPRLHAYEPHAKAFGN